MSSSTSSSANAAVAPREQLAGLKSDLEALATKMGELEQERDEHQLVLDTISPMDPGRKCFRLVGGVLVERTIRDVVPAVTTNMEGIKQIIGQLQQSFKIKEAEYLSLQKKHNIK
ncbi:hypothetical protein SeMB42_g00327 [Synchytrium endobioticum]|uniref:Prefoldin subunit 2 n=1 Tax=Synchytrium endobioticum TaxID=286115 RepID=A0A507DRK3_9FUNG|nr:hypothetical protein SeLEV6574_g01863 [Synchytrium endobioticum]TPX54343.1 hypothetical protein SeMB42_g00327 [Synchytrium endobioticum]